MVKADKVARMVDLMKTSLHKEFAELKDTPVTDNPERYLL